MCEECEREFEEAIMDDPGITAKEFYRGMEACYVVIEDADQFVEHCNDDSKLEAARVQQINDQISALNTKVTNCNNTLENLQTSRTNLKQTVSGWNRVYNSCKTSTITQKVVVNNKFEGVCVKAISKSLPNAVSEMNENKNGINDVISKLDTQITKLKNHISTLNGKITNLRNSI